MDIFRDLVCVFILGLSAALPGLGVAEQRSGETHVILGCSGGKFAVEQSDGTTKCFCQQGEKEVLGLCVSDSLIDAFRINVENFPNSARAHDSLAEALERSGRTRLAVASYRRALDFDPDKKSARDGLTRLQYRDGKAE